MPQITHKPVTLDDWQLLVSLEKIAKNPFYFACDSEEMCKQYIRESHVYFLMDGKKPIGTISHKTEPDGTILINGLTVLPEYRGKGIAHAALKQLLEELGDHQNYALHVHPANTPALLIYLRLGFVITGWEDHHFGDGEPRLYLRRLASHSSQ